MVLPSVDTAPDDSCTSHVSFAVNAYRLPLRYSSAVMLSSVVRTNVFDALIDPGKPPSVTYTLAPVAKTSAPPALQPAAGLGNDASPR